MCLTNTLNHLNRGTSEASLLAMHPLREPYTHTPQTTETTELLNGKPLLLPLRPPTGGGSKVLEQRASFIERNATYKYTHCFL